MEDNIKSRGIDRSCGGEDLREHEDRKVEEAAAQTAELRTLVLLCSLEDSRGLNRGTFMSSNDSRPAIAWNDGNV